MATVLQKVFGYQSRLNAFVAGIAIGLAIIPVVFSIAEDALTSVPRSYTQAALALGSSKWQAAWQIVLPAAIPGVFAAVMLGFGRAIGETMIVVIASANASIVSWNIFDSLCCTMTATIAAELRRNRLWRPALPHPVHAGRAALCGDVHFQHGGGIGHQPAETKLENEAMNAKSSRPFESTRFAFSRFSPA